MCGCDETEGCVSISLGLGSSLSTSPLSHVRSYVPGSRQRKRVTGCVCEMCESLGTSCEYECLCMEESVPRDTGPAPL